MLKEDVLELRWLFSVIRRRLWLIVGFTLLCTACALFVTSRMPPVYSASVSLLVDMAPDLGRNDYNSILASERLARTYTEMLTGRPVMEAVIAQLGLEETPDALAKRVKVKLIPDTQLIRLSVEDNNPARVALLANTVAEAFIAQNEALQVERYADSLANLREQIDGVSALIEQAEASIDALGTPATSQDLSELNRQEKVLAEHRSTYATLVQEYDRMRLTAVQSMDNAIVVETAEVPDRPLSRRELYTALAAVVGATLGLGMAFLLEHLDDKIKMPEDAGHTLGLDALDTIGWLTNWEDRLVLITDPRSSLAKVLDLLHTNSRLSGADRPLGTFLLTSPSNTTEKSTIVADVAVATAQAGFKVVAVDADLHHPRLHHLFGLPPRREGLSRALLEGAIDGRLQPALVPELKVLTSGDLPPDPAALLQCQHMQILLDALAQQADVVLIDSPPVTPVADALLLAPMVDGVLLLVEVGETPQEATQHALERLLQVGAKLVVVVLNGATAIKEDVPKHALHIFGMRNESLVAADG